MNKSKDSVSEDYAVASEMMVYARDKLDSLLKLVSESSRVSKTLNRAIYMELEEVASTCVACCNLVDYSPGGEE